MVSVPRIQRAVVLPFRSASCRPSSCRSPRITSFLRRPRAQSHAPGQDRDPVVDPDQHPRRSRQQKKPEEAAAGPELVEAGAEPGASRGRLRRNAGGGRRGGPAGPLRLLKRTSRSGRRRTVCRRNGITDQTKTAQIAKLRAAKGEDQGQGLGRETLAPVGVRRGACHLEEGLVAGRGALAEDVAHRAEDAVAAEGEARHVVAQARLVGGDAVAAGAAAVDQGGGAVQGGAVLPGGVVPGGGAGVSVGLRYQVRGGDPRRYLHPEDGLLHPGTFPGRTGSWLRRGYASG
nr:unnamed protein product [Callosobruchus analis]